MFDKQRLLVAALFAGFSSLALAQSAALRDPTTPLGYRAEKSPDREFNLQAIFGGAGKKRAIVDGRVVYEGDTIHGKTILYIGKQEIGIADTKGKSVLRLRPSIFSQ